MKLYTNSGYVSEVLRGTGEAPSLHNDIACEQHAPKKGTPLWKRQGWRPYKGSGECRSCKYNRIVRSEIPLYDPARVDVFYP